MQVMNEADVKSATPAAAITIRATASHCQEIADEFMTSTLVVAIPATITHKRDEGNTDNSIDSVAASNNNATNKNAGRHPVDELDVGIDSINNENNNRGSGDTLTTTTSTICAVARVTTATKSAADTALTSRYNNKNNPYGAGFIFPQRVRTAKLWGTRSITTIQRALAFTLEMLDHCFANNYLFFPSFQCVLTLLCLTYSYE
jgi:hypothetical protein